MKKIKVITTVQGGADPFLRSLNTPFLEQRISEMQAVQKCNPPTSAEWQAASVELGPMFAEMARRSR